MSKRMFVMALAAVLLLSLGAAGLSQEVQEEFTAVVVAEHGFEGKNLHGWVPRGGIGSISTTTEAAYSGSSCLKFTGRNQDWHMPRVEITKYL